MKERIYNILYNIFISKVSNKKRKTVTLVYLNKINKNGRIYTKECIEKHIDDFNKTVRRTGSTYGQIGHPDTTDLSLKNASHTIEDVRIVGDLVIGTVQTMNTYWGKLLSRNMNSYVFRSRGVGCVGTDNVVNLVKLITFDAIFVSEDSWAKK